MGTMQPLLDQFLAVLDVGVAAFTTCDVRLGWQLVFEPSRTASLHYCLAGTGAMTVGSRPPIALRQHSFVVLPARLAYSIEAGYSGEKDRSSRHGRLHAPPFEESVPLIRAGDGAAGVLTACGEVRLAHAWTPDLFAALDTPLIEHFEGPDGLRNQFVMLLAEVARPQIGTRALTEALLKQCLVLLLRRRLERGTVPLPWMGALTDHRMAAALAALLESPWKPFTVESLARLAGMSRSAFAAQFSRMFARSPMNLLREVRLRRATELLVTTTLPVEAIARKVGFASRSNFSRAFREMYKVYPSGYRARASKRDG